MLPILVSLLSPGSVVGDPNDFSISFNLNLSGEEHATLAGLPLSRRSTKDLISQFNEQKASFLDSMEQFATEEIIEFDDKTDDDNSEDKPSGQMTLF